MLFFLRRVFFLVNIFEVLCLLGSIVLGKNLVNKNEIKIKFIISWKSDIFNNNERKRMIYFLMLENCLGN